MQFERGQLNRRDAMDAEGNEEEPNQIRSLEGEWFLTDPKLNLLCVDRVSVVSFRLHHSIGTAQRRVEFQPALLHGWRQTKATRSMSVGSSLPTESSFFQNSGLCAVAGRSMLSAA